MGLGTSRYLILPAITTSVIPMGIITRTVRALTGDILSQDFVEALRAKGLHETDVFKHVIKNAAPTAMAVMGLQLGYMLGGSILLLRTSNDTFVLLIPWLLLFAAVLFSFGKRASAFLTRGAKASLGAVVIAQLAISIYGGYFGGGMGIMMLAILSLMGMTDIHKMNGLKTVLAALINGVAVVAFIMAGAVTWGPGLVMVAGGIAGGYAGAAIARRVSPSAVRLIVLIVAWTMTAYFFVKTYAR